MQPLDPIDVLPVVPGERSALLTLLDDLAPADWARPTVCPGWSVKDLCQHLLADDLGRLSRGRDDYADPTFAEGIDIATWDGLVAAIDRQNDRWVRATRRLSPRLIGQLLALTGEWTAAYFATLDPMAIGGPVDWAGPEAAPVWFDLAREYTERWVHQQQIRDAVGRPGLTERRWFAPVLETFVRAVPHTLREVDSAPGAHLRLTITGEAGGRWDLLRDDDRWRLGTGAAGSPLAALVLDQETAWRLFTKGIAPDEARRDARMSGDVELAARMLETVAIIA